MWFPKISRLAAMSDAAMKWAFRNKSVKERKTWENRRVLSSFLRRDSACSVPHLPIYSSPANVSLARQLLDAAYSWRSRVGSSHTDEGIFSALKAPPNQQYSNGSSPQL